MKRDKLLRKALGSTDNLRFGDLVTLAEMYGFRLDRVSGSHHIFIHPMSKVMINLQNYRGKAKPYQIHQFLQAIGEQ